MCEYFEAIEKLCKFAFTFSNMNTVFVDWDSNLLLDFGYNQVPQPLKGYLGNMYDALNIHKTPDEYKAVVLSNSYKINFISTKIYNRNKYLGTIIVGPYLLEEPTAIMIQNVLFENNLPISLRYIISHYYLSLPLISTYNAKAIAEFLAYSSSNLSTIYSENPSIGNLSYNFKNEQTHISDTISKNLDISMDIIEKRYSVESRLMHAIERGNKEEAMNLINTEDFFAFIKIPDRIPNDPLRSKKNLTFVFNTLLRVAAKNGGLHPIYIHSISEKFAIQIEKASSIQQILDLHKTMISSYCDAVKKFTLNEFSYPVRKVIEFIRVNLSRDLNLDIISKAINISPYNLSRQFKSETKESLTDYINKQRINEALYLISNEDLLITDIAEMVGFNDVNYFTKVFKKIKGITPSEYKKKGM